MTTRGEISLDPTPIRTYVGVLARRKWLFVLVLVVVPLAAVVVSLQRDSQYEATSEVLLSDKDLAGALSGSQGALAVDPTRIVSTQASIARTPDLARRVLRQAGVPPRTASDLLAASEVAPVGSTNVLEFRVRDPAPGVAERLATAYAAQFVLYTRAIETDAIDRARKGVVSQMARLARQGGRNSALYATLAEKAQTLETMAALQTSRAQLLRRAEGAVKVEPRPKRSGVYGFVVAVVLGLGLIALLEALDTRVRTETEIGDALGVQPVGRIAEPPRGLRRDGVTVLQHPDGADAEAFRVLRANIEYANSELDARTILITSSVRGEGKSTTAANIAASFARFGKRVILVDLDLRRPSVHLRYGLTASPGVSDVVLGRVALDKALVKVSVASRGRASGRSFRRWASGSSGNGPSNSTVGSEPTGSLEILPAGATPNDVGEFMGVKGISELLDSLRGRADIVFVDAPPALEASDPLTLMAQVDALVAVARLGVVRHPMLKDLRRIMTASSVATLGVVITGVDPSDGYGPYHPYGAYDAETAEPVAHQAAGAQRAGSALHVVHERPSRPTTT